MCADGPRAGPASADHEGEPDRGGERRRRLVALLDGDGPAGSATATAGGSVDPRGRAFGPERLQRLCVVTVSEVQVDGAGITVMGGVESGRTGHRDQLASVGALTRPLEDLQLTAGEGPCLDAYDSGIPVLIADVATETTRWLGFGPEAISAGAVAVFSLPLQVGAVNLGTLDMNRTTIGSLSRDQLADALALAGLATETLLELAQDVDGTPDGGHDVGDTGEGPGGPAGWLPDVHADVHVASGMVSAQAGVDPASALMRIRAHAFASGEPINAVARRIIDRDLDLSDTGTGRPESPDGPPAPDSENDDS